MPVTLEIRPYNSLGDDKTAMPRKKTAVEEEAFGRRLARLRKDAGYSQRLLAGEIDMSQRMVAYYEVQSACPPSHLLMVIADALGLSVDQLLGHSAVTARRAPVNQHLLRELRKVEKLPPHARRSVLEHIDGLTTKYGTRG